MTDNPPSLVYFNANDLFLYPVKAGDTLARVLSNLYGIYPTFGARYRHLVKLAQAHNPQINHDNRLAAGDTLYLPMPERLLLAECDAEPSSKPSFRAPHSLERMAAHIPTHPQQREAFSALALLQERVNFLTIPGSVLLGSTSYLVSPANISYVEEVDSLYQRYQRGVLSKGQYDYRRRKALNQLATNFGPMEKLLFRGKSAAQSVRIARGGGIPANAEIAKHAARLSRLARYANNGGLILTGVGMYAGCLQMGAAASRKEKNEILAETVTGSIAGVATGAAITAFMVTNPVGWTVAIALAVGATATSWGAGKLARESYGYLYNRYGEKIDLASMSGVDQLCK